MVISEDGVFFAPFLNFLANQLGGGLNPKYLSNLIISPGRVENKKCFKPPSPPSQKLSPSDDNFLEGTVSNVHYLFLHEIFSNIFSPKNFAT